MNKLTVTFDRSNEDIPVLVITSESVSFFGPTTTRIENILSGEVANDVWDLLQGKKLSLGDILGTRINTVSSTEVEMMLNNEKSEDSNNDKNSL